MACADVCGVVHSLRTLKKGGKEAGWLMPPAHLAVKVLVLNRDMAQLTYSLKPVSPPELEKSESG